MQARLTDPDLGVLELGTLPYVVPIVQIGSPAVRAVARVRALADGTHDESRFLGARAVTLSLRLRNYSSACITPTDMQALIDRVIPYMSPRRRPILSYQMPESVSIRSMIVRGDTWPVAWSGPKFPVLPLGFVCPSGEIWSGAGPNSIDPICTIIRPSTDVEAGRTYDLSFDRVYPAGSPPGERVIVSPGTDWSHWTLTIFGATTNPTFMVNGILIDLGRNGGVNLLAGQTVVIDTRSKTILLNDDPAASLYDRSNYNEWAWSDLMLRPGRNVVRFGGDTLTDSSQAQLCYLPTFLA